MVGEYPKRRFESNRMETDEQIIKRFIAQSIIGAILARGSLYRAFKYSPEKMPQIQAYQDFIAAFSNAFIATRHNIKRSFKIPDWDDKIKKSTGEVIIGKDTTYNNFFVNNSNTSPKNIVMGLKLFDEFMEDLVRSGIYALLEESAIGDEGFEDETEKEEGVIEEA